MAMQLRNEGSEVILPKLKHNPAEGLSLTQQQLVERFHRTGGKQLYDSSGKMPPYLAMKKMILDQQLKNSALFSMPLISTGGGTGMQLKGERMVHLYQS